MDDPSIYLTCLFAILLGLIPASIAKNKGHDFITWWVFGSALFIIALVAVFLIEDKTKKIVQQGNMKKCPYCAELIMKDAIVCRFCGKDLPTVSSISLEIKSLVKERKLTPTVIQDNEIPIWKAGFSSMGWFEEIGQNTLATLNKSQDRFGTVQEPLLCVTYADTKGSHISEVQLNNKNLTSPFTALIATTKRFVFVEPNNKSVESIEHKNIHKIETNAQAGKKTYILTTTFGDTALLGVIFSSDEDASILESFFERVISVK